MGNWGCLQHLGGSYTKESYLFGSTYGDPLFREATKSVLGFSGGTERRGIARRKVQCVTLRNAHPLPRRGTFPVGLYLCTWHQGSIFTVQVPTFSVPRVCPHELAPGPEEGPLAALVVAIVGRAYRDCDQRGIFLFRGPMHKVAVEIPQRGELNHINRFSAGS